MCHNNGSLEGRKEQRKKNVGMEEGEVEELEIGGNPNEKTEALYWLKL